MFIPVLFKTDKSKNNPNIHQWINGSIKCGIEPYSVVFGNTRNDLHVTMWMNLKNIMLDELNLSQTTIYILELHLYKMPKIGISIKTENKSVVYLGLWVGIEGLRLLSKETGVAFEGTKNF